MNFFFFGVDVWRFFLFLIFESITERHTRLSPRELCYFFADDVSVLFPFADTRCFSKLRQINTGYNMTCIIIWYTYSAATFYVTSSGSRREVKSQSEFIIHTHARCIYSKVGKRRSIYKPYVYYNVTGYIYNYARYNEYDGIAPVKNVAARSYTQARIFVAAAAAAYLYLQSLAFYIN